MKKILVSIFAFFTVSIIFFTGCSSKNLISKKSYEEIQFEKEKNLILTKLSHQNKLDNKISIGIVGNPKNLNPFLAHDKSSMTILNSIYDPLYYNSYNDNPENFDFVLAKNAILSKDKKSFKLTLNENITWHDNKKLTIEDLLYTLDVIKNSNTVYDKLLTKDEKLSYKKISENTIEFKSDFISPSFIYQLGKVRIVPKHIYLNHEKDKLLDSYFLIGNGPFKYQSHEYDFIKVVRNDNYYKEKAILNELKFLLVNHKTSTRFSLLNFEVQLGYTQAKDENGFVNTPFVYNSVDSGEIHGILLNTNSENVKNEETRNAINMLFSKPDITGLYGTSNTVQEANSIFGNITKYKINQSLFYKYNPAVSSELFMKAKENNKNFSIKMPYIVDPGEPQDNYSVKLEELFKNINVKFDLEPLFVEEFDETLKNFSNSKYDFLMFDYVSGEDPDDTSKYFASNGSMNYNGYKNEEIDKLYIKAYKEKDEAKKQEIYNKIQETILNSQYIVPVAYVKNSITYDDRLKGISKENLDSDTLVKHLNKIYIEELDSSTFDLKKYNINLENTENTLKKNTEAVVNNRKKLLKIYQEKKVIPTFTQILLK